MGSLRSPDFSGFIARIARQLAERRVPYMLIGGQAVLVHGRPRLTEDIDITLGLGPAGLQQMMELCRAVGLDPLPENAEEFVQETFVLPTSHGPSGIRVDFIFSTTHYEQQAIARAIQIEVDGVPVAFATAEDLIIHKLFAGRARDQEDAISVAARQRNELDWDYLERWAQEFATVPGREEMPKQVASLRERA